MDETIWSIDEAVSTGDRIRADLFLFGELAVSAWVTGGPNPSCEICLPKRTLETNDPRTLVTLGKAFTQLATILKVVSRAR